MMYKHFGELLQELRIARKLSREALSRKANGAISAVHIGRLERGEAPSTRLNSIRALAKGFDMDYAELAQMIANIGHPIWGFKDLKSPVKLKAPLEKLSNEEKTILETWNHLSEEQKGTIKLLTSGWLKGRVKKKSA